MAENRIVKAALTGSIAMGKSTVAQMFRDANVPVFDADAAVHQLYARHGEAVEPVGAVFPDVIKQGAIDRGQLARHVLQDAAAMAISRRCCNRLTDMCHLSDSTASRSGVCT